MKKWWLDAICMLSVTAIALSGCKSTTAAGELQLQPEKQEKTVLTLFLPIESSNTSSTYTYQDIISSFNAQSDSIEVRVEGMSTGDGYNEALERRLDDTARSQATVDGTAYCLPTKMSAYGLYVNVGLLEQYGLEPPQNADQFLHCCQVLKDNGITPISINRWYAMTAVAMGRGLYPIYQSGNTNEIISGLNDGSIKISEYMLEGFRFFADLEGEGGLSVFDTKNANGDPAVQALYADAVSPGQIPIEDMQLCFDYWGSIRTLCLDIIGGATPEEAAMNYDRIQAKKVEDNAP